MASKQPTPLVLDLSHHNTVTSFADVFSAGIRGVILKSSQGSTSVDKTYAQRRKDARWAGLLTGAYHFCDSSNVKNQVSNFLRAADPDDATLLAVDWEPNGRWTMTLDQVKEFLQLVYEKTGQVPVLYSGNLVKETLSGRPDPVLSRHRLWIAQYGAKAVLPPGWDNYWLWQYAEKGKIAGLGDSFVDFNHFGGKNLAEEWVCRTAKNVVELNPTKLAPNMIPNGAGGAIAGVTAAVKGAVTGEAFPIPAADPPKDAPKLPNPQELTFTDKAVTKRDLIPVSRKAKMLNLLTRKWQVLIGLVSLDKIMQAMDVAKDTRTQVESFCDDHKTAIYLTIAITSVMGISYIWKCLAEDVNEGRAVASGSVTPPQG